MALMLCGTLATCSPTASLSPAAPLVMWQLSLNQWIGEREPSASYGSVAAKAAAISENFRSSMHRPRESSLRSAAASGPVSRAGSAQNSSICLTSRKTDSDTDAPVMRRNVTNECSKRERP